MPGPPFDYVPPGRARAPFPVPNPRSNPANFPLPPTRSQPAITGLAPGGADATLSTGPYQGAAGTELQNPGRSRVPPADWATPGANFERRNYYISPNGEIVAREPGYYNPENPWDTGRPGEVNEEFGKWDPSAERRMSEPGVTPWGPGGRASAPGAFAAPAAGPQRAQGMDFARSLLGDIRTSPVVSGMPGMGVDPNEELTALLAGLAGQVGQPGRSQPALPPGFGRNRPRRPKRRSRPSRGLAA